ncbi:uncharacterized protein LOC117115415 isoform X2 [Anneissia japonica]|uniref:uncharacterized protein LOC117115415 isoform X2 n=1 Tax=Anneissia japonica TaxID=1529436 RepID=UPI0014259473|nr:uncharacterized protein LOC117115415 isoform X2 [Anneissia japonica]
MLNHGHPLFIQSNHTDLPDCSDVIVINDNDEQDTKLPIKNEGLKEREAQNSMQSGINLPSTDIQDLWNDVEHIIGKTETKKDQSFMESNSKLKEWDFSYDVETIFGKTGTSKEITTESVATSDSNNSGTDCTPPRKRVKRPDADDINEHMPNNVAQSNDFQFGKQNEPQGQSSQFNSKPQLISGQYEVTSPFGTRFAPGSVSLVNQVNNNRANDLRHGTKGSGEFIPHSSSLQSVMHVPYKGLPDRKSSSTASCTVSRHPDSNSSFTGASGYTGASAHSFILNESKSSISDSSKQTKNSPLNAASHHRFDWQKADHGNVPQASSGHTTMIGASNQSENSSFKKFDRNSHVMQSQFDGANSMNLKYPGGLNPFGNQGHSTNDDQPYDMVDGEIPMHTNVKMDNGNNEHISSQVNLNGQSYVINQVNINDPVNTANHQVDLSAQVSTDHMTPKIIEIPGHSHLNACRDQRAVYADQVRKNILQARMNNQMQPNYQVHTNQMTPEICNNQKRSRLNAYRDQREVYTDQVHTGNLQVMMNNLMQPNHPVHTHLHPNANQHMAINNQVHNQVHTNHPANTNQPVAINNQVHPNHQVAVNEQVHANLQENANQPVAINDDLMAVAVELPGEMTIDIQMVEVMNLIPDIQLEFLRNKLKEFKEVNNELAVQRAVNYLLENPYPKQSKDVPKKARDQSEETDYFKDFSRMPSFDYLRQVVCVMQARHSKLSTKFLRDILQIYNYHFAPAEKSIQEIIRAHKTLSECLSLYSKMTYEGEVKLTVGKRDTSLRIKTLKCRRSSQMPREISRELQNEIDFYEMHVMKELENKDREFAITLNGQEYEQEGQLIECGCCYGEVPFEDMIQCSDGHLFCSTCMCSYAKEAIYGSGKLKLSCMTDGCEAGFPKSQLDKCLPKDMIAKYEDRQKEESLNLAGIDDLVKCPSCEFAAIMDSEDKVFKCQNPECLKESCRYCKESWKDHFGLPCSEIERKDETSLRVTYEERMTNAKMRTCFRCKTGYMKSDGCNKITCRCGAKMCYICRKPNIDYNHFCQHVRNPGQGCTTCEACSLWSDSKEDDERAVKEIQKQLQEERQAKGFDTSKSAGGTVPSREPEPSVANQLIFGLNMPRPQPVVQHHPYIN